MTCLLAVQLQPWGESGFGARWRQAHLAAHQQRKVRWWCRSVLLKQQLAFAAPLPCGGLQHQRVPAGLALPLMCMLKKWAGFGRRLGQ